MMVEKSTRRQSGIVHGTDSADISGFDDIKPCMCRSKSLGGAPDISWKELGTLNPKPLNP